MRILWVSPFRSFPPRNGGQLRIANLIRQSLARGHEVELWTVSGATEEAAELPDRLTYRWMRERNGAGAVARARRLANPLPAWAWRIQGGEALAAAAAVIASQVDVAVCEYCHCGVVGEELGRRGIPWVLDEHNVEWRLVADIAAASRGRTRVAAQQDARRLRRLDKRLLGAADAVAAVSAADRTDLLSLHPEARVDVVSNGVDLAFHHWRDHSRPRDASLLFTASLEYPPNLDAVRWIRSDLIAELRRRNSDILVRVVGSLPDPVPGDLLEPVPGVEIVGAVPDIRPYFADADAYLMPLRIGSGTRLKALEAFAAGLPVVSTAVGIDGLDVEPAGVALVAEDAAGLAEQAVRVLSDVPLRRRLATTARHLVEQRFGWDRVGETMDALLREVAGKRR